MVSKSQASPAEAAADLLNRNPVDRSLIQAIVDLNDIEQDFELMTDLTSYYDAPPVVPETKPAETRARCAVVRSATYEEMAKDAENVRKAILASVDLTPDLRVEVDWRLKTLRGKYDDLAARDVSSILEAKSSQTCFDIAGDVVRDHVALLGRELAKTRSVSKVLSEGDPVFSRMLRDEGRDDALNSLRESKTIVVSFLKSRKDAGVTKTSGLKNILASYAEIFSCGTVPWCAVHPQKIRETLRNSAVSHYLESAGDDRSPLDVLPSDFIDQPLDDRINLLSIVLGVWLNDRVDEFSKSYLRATKNDPNYVKCKPSYDTDGSARLFETVIEGLIYWPQAYALFEKSE